MKKTIFVSFYLIMLFFLNCINSNTKVRENANCDSLLIGKDVTEGSITVYKIDKKFYTHLDSIILNEEKCAYYNRCLSGFSFSVQQSENENIKIEINSANIHSHDYSNCFGVFEYGDYLFICDGLKTREILNPTKFKKKIKYLNIDRSQWEISHDDRFSTWYFELNNDILQLRGHHPCPKEKFNND